MWTVIHIAPNRSVAEKIKDILTREGLLCRLNSNEPPTSGGGGYVEVMVPETEAVEALEILQGVLER